MNELRKFTNTDYDGYAGAAMLPDDTWPWIRDFDGAHVIVCGYEDHPGCIEQAMIEVNLFIYDGDNFQDTLVFQSEPMPQRLAEVIARGMTPADCNRDALLTMRFRPL